jgi:hypothetical protein
MVRRNSIVKQPKAIASTQSLSAFVKSICDVMRRSNCASALQYVPELTWILFLRILDAQEARDQEQAEAVGASFAPALREPYRWQDWAAPWSEAESRHPKTAEGQTYGWKRQELFAAGDGQLFEFINKELLPHLHSLDVDPRTNLPRRGATPKQRIIGRIMTAVERVRVDSETNLRDILDKVHEISIDHLDDQHFFTLSQVYEDLLLEDGRKELRRRPVLHPARGDPRDGAYRGPPLGRRCTTPAAAPAAFSPSPTSTSPASLVSRRAAPTSTRSSTTRSLAARRRTWFFLSRWPTWCCTASISPTCGMAIR